MLWAETDMDDGTPLDSNYGLDDISNELLTSSKEDVEKFLKLASEKVDLYKYDIETVGHDFFLTRSNHGAGFWDGDYGDVDGEVLTKISKEFKEVHPYVGDDEEIYG
jgi:hypothetical protein